MSEQDIEAKLERLLSLRTKLAKQEKSRDELRAKVLKPVQDKLDRIDARYDEEAKPILDKMVKIEESVKNAVVEAGVTVSADGVQAVYYHPKETWDSQKLKGLALAHPQINQCLKAADSGTCQLRYKK